jgi:outer membrane protein assembly factor BamB
MSKLCRTGVVLLSHLGLLTLLFFLQTADAAPQDKAPAGKKEEKAKEPAKEKAADKKDKAADKKAEATDKKDKTEAKKDTAVKAEPAPAAAVPAVQMKMAATAVAAPGGAPAAPPAGEKFTDALTLPQDRKIAQKLKSADEDGLQQQRWAEASQALQSILNKDGDVFVQVKRKGVNGQEKIHWVSAKAEANRLLGTMPKDGLEIYEVQFGAEAKRLLKQAKETGDPQLLAEVAHRFFHTEAGIEATDLLGTYHLDRGGAIMAALCYERLLHRAGADQLTPLALFKATLAFRRAGDDANRKLAQETWKKLEAKIKREGLRVNDETVDPAQLQQELDRASALIAASSPFDWTMFRGNSTRTAKGRGSAPFLASKWQKSNLEHENLHTPARQVIQSSLEQQKYQPGATPLPAFFPIAAGGKVIYRSYVGIHAVDVQTGELAWESMTTAGLEALMHDFNKKQDVSTWLAQYKQAGSQNILFENSMVGTLSTDNSRIYAVDDLAVPPHPGNQQFQPWGGMPGQGMTGQLREVAERSRLVAIDLESGKLLWERGDPQHDDNKLQTAGAYFLGPPLPLGGKLFVLAEKNAELQLLCLEPTKGEVIWTQTLATARDRLMLDVSRRLQAVHLAYDEGILVCPTNAGAVLGVDLLSRSLVWAYPYREKTPEPAQDDRARRVIRNGVVIQRFGGMGGADWYTNLQKMPGDWKMTAPIIAEGKVVFTAPDGAAIHCLNLRDGDAVWREPRRDDVYLAGIFDGKVLLVGKHTCRALHLSNGKEAWKPVDLGTATAQVRPSGQGVASGSFYYLPLKNGDKGEVCKINIETGKVEGRSPAPGTEVPGNLLFYEGNVISQTETTVTAYPQVEFQVAQIDQHLRDKPNDPVWLTERGKLHLFKGDLALAVADLHSALNHQPPAELVPTIRSRLYSTLTELLRDKFKEGQQYLAEYKELCGVPIPDKASPEERQKLAQEERQRLAGFYGLVAKGYEDEGRVVDAFQAYLDLGALAKNHENELVSIINAPIQVKPEVWAQGKIAALIARLNPAQLKPLEEEIGRRWQAVLVSKDLKEERQFVAAYGELFAIGREARLHLAERLLEANATLEAEQHLSQLRQQKDDPRIGGRAVEVLARMMTRKKDLELAAYYYRILAREFATVVIRDGKTGAELFRELAADPRFWPYLDGTDFAVLGGPIKIKEIFTSPNPAPKGQPFEAKSELLPVFRRHRFTWTPVHSGMSAYQLSWLESDSGDELWSLNSAPTRASFINNNNANTHFPYYTQGHLAVLYLGHTVYGLDLTDPKKPQKLWDKELLNPAQLSQDNPNFQQILDLDVDGALHLSNAQGTRTKIGQIGPVTPSYVCLLTQEGLVALEPTGGKVLWTKSKITPQTRIFGDDEYVYLVEVRNDNTVGSTQALRGRDGAVVEEVPEFATSFQRRKRILGGRLLVKENDPTGAEIYRLYDIRSGKDLWTETLPPNAVVLQAEDPELFGFVRRSDGQLKVIDLRTQKPVLQSTVARAHLDNVTNEGSLFLQDSRQYYVVLNRPNDPGNAQGPYPNVAYLRTARAHGRVYAFDKATGEVAWHNPVENQMVLLEQFEDLPILLFTARVNKQVNVGINAQARALNNPRGMSQIPVILSIDKHTGRRLKDGPPQSDFPQAQTAFHSLRIDRKNGTIDLIAHNLIVRHYLDTGESRAALNGARDQGTKGLDARGVWVGRTP